MRLPTTLPILTTLLPLTRAADPRISCSRSSSVWGTVFRYTVSGYGNSAFPDNTCTRLRDNLKPKVACVTYSSDTCYTHTDGTYVFWTFEVWFLCHSGVSFFEMFSFLLALFFLIDLDTG